MNKTFTLITNTFQWVRSKPKATPVNKLVFNRQSVCQVHIVIITMKYEHVCIYL